MHLFLVHKIKLGIAPDYLSEKITRHLDLHDYNTRGRNNIAVQRVNTSIRSNSFFIYISKLYNDILPLLDVTANQTISVNSFRTKCKSRLKNLQFPH